MFRIAPVPNSPLPPYDEFIAIETAVRAILAGILHLRAQADVGERVLPLGQTDVHQHQPEVMSEGFGHEVPTQGSVKEPDLRVLT